MKGIEDFNLIWGYLDIGTDKKCVLLETKTIESSYANRTNRANNQSISTIRQAVSPAFCDAQGINNKPSKTLEDSTKGEHLRACILMQFENTSLRS